jgi:hypothetical protein
MGAEVYFSTHERYFPNRMNKSFIDQTKHQHTSKLLIKFILIIKDTTNKILIGIKF